MKLLRSCLSTVIAMLLYLILSAYAEEFFAAIKKSDFSKMKRVFQQLQDEIEELINTIKKNRGISREDYLPITSTPLVEMEDAQQIFFIVDRETGLNAIQTAIMIQNAEIIKRLITEFKVDLQETGVLGIRVQEYMMQNGLSYMIPTADKYGKVKECYSSHRIGIQAPELYQNWRL